MSVAALPAQEPIWYATAPHERAERLRWLADQVLFLADEWRQTWDMDARDRLLRCTIHARPHLGDCVDPDATAVCPLCAVSARVRELTRHQQRLEVLP